jgi:GT2 family glycosyltransferase
VRVLDFPENLYFSRGFNEGIRASAPDSEYVVVFCNDVEVKRDDWLDDMLRAAARPGVVAAGHAERGRRLSAEQREILRRNAPAYEDAELRERMARLLDDPGAAYTHLHGYCFLLARRALERTGLYLEGGDFRQYHSDWEWCLRFAALGLEVADARPGVHHWHSVSELIAFHPQRYRELLARMDDAQTLARYLEEGRPLFAEESGYRAWAAQRRARGESDGDGE